MDFIDQVDFIARASGGVLDIIQQFARILYLGTRSSINLQQVYAATFSNLQAGGTAPAGDRTDASLAVKTLGKDTCDGGLANPSGTRKEIGMMQSIMI